MKRGLIILLALLAATFLANFFMREDAGYAMVNFRGYAVETSFLGLILFAILAYVAVRLIVRSIGSVSDLGRAAGRYQKNRSQKKLTRGLIELAEGNYARGERLLAESAHKSDTPVLNYLNAARAAQEQGAADRRDNWLMMAYENDADSARAVLLTQAQLQTQDKDYERALATLRKLEEQAPGHPQGLALLAKIYERLGDWDNLRELLPQLRKRKALPPAQIDELAQRTWSTLLEHDSAGGDVVGLQRQWQNVPKKLKKDPVLLRDYVAALNKAGDQPLAEQAIRKALKTRWDPELVDLYGRLENTDAARSLAYVQSLLKYRANDPVLLLTAARLAMRAGQLGEAQKYLEDGVKTDATPEAYQLLGAVLTDSGKPDEAAVAFRQGLALATGRSESTLPAVAASTPDAERSEGTGNQNADAV